MKAAARARAYLLLQEGGRHLLGALPDVISQCIPGSHLLTFPFPV